MIHDPSTGGRPPAQRTGRVLGWASGLALLVVPWIAAGVLATVVTMVGPDSWDAESSFPWLLLAVFSAAICWVAWASVRIPGFRQGALPGTVVALTAIAGLYLLARIVGT